MTYVTCSFDTDIAPGASVDLPEPLRLAVTDHALYERFDYEVQPGGDATDLDGSDNGRSWHITADNTADFAVRGTEVSGAAGDTVTAAFRFVNRGPAWVGNVSSGDPVAVIDYYLPEGTTATSVPDTCRNAWTSGDDPAIGHYACTLPLWAKPDEGQLSVPAAHRPRRPRRDGPRRRPPPLRHVLHLRFEQQEQLGQGGRQPVRLTAVRGGEPAARPRNRQL